LMTAMAFSIRRVAPSPRCVYRHVLCHQSAAMAFSIRRVAPSPRCVYRHILCHRSAQHAVDPCRDTAARPQVPFRSRRSTSTRFHSTCISPRASRPSRSRDRRQAHGHSHRGGSRHDMSCPARPCCRLRALAGLRRLVRCGAIKDDDIVEAKKLVEELAPRLSIYRSPIHPSP
jgi:hypothetical protein